MREIKFRVWDYTKHRYYYYDGIFNEAFKHRKILQPSAFEQYNKTLIQQFTGLKDKNGKEIYEGDIIRKFDSDDRTKYEYKAVVEYKQEICMFYGHIIYPSLDLVRKFCVDYYYSKGFKLDTADPTIEVIGNTFENPELNAPAY